MLDEAMVVESKLKNKTKKEEKQMKKSTKKVVVAKKSVIVKPAMAYTRSQVAEFLGLSAGSSVCPSKYGMSVRKGKIQGRDVIAYLESGSCRKFKIGRKYASGSVSVVAR